MFNGGVRLSAPKAKSGSLVWGRREPLNSNRGSLSLPENLSRGNITLNNAIVYTTGNSGGAVELSANQLDASNSFFPCRLNF